MQRKVLQGATDRAAVQAGGIRLLQSMFLIFNGLTAR